MPPHKQQLGHTLLLLLLLLLLHLELLRLWGLLSINRPYISCCCSSSFCSS